MLFSDSHILTTILFTPLVGAILMLFIKRENASAHRLMGNLFAFLGFLVSLPLIWRFNSSAAARQFQFLVDHSWIPSIGARFTLGIDGLGFLMVMLTTILGLISIFSSWSAIQKREKEYYILFLLLQTGMLGVFMSLDFVLFYVFWEVMLVPMYFLIGVWGSERRLYAAIKFFLYTLAGSVLMLLAILAIYFNAHTFSILEILQSPNVMFSMQLQ
jgi:NADH-quinone oxidoreductase subunit M